jgi:hypothetical protein
VYKGYVIHANGICSTCASTDLDCKYCLRGYFYDGQECRHGSLIPNYDYTTAFTCLPGYTVKINPYNNRKMGCVCSFAAKHYKNSDKCLPCSAVLPPLKLTDCQACSAAAKFYKGSSECVYCPGAFMALGTATANGCDCPRHYFWNSNTGKCECDFVLGFIGGAISPCIDCSKIANTAVTPLPNACSCLPGFKWTPNKNTCICDSSSPSALTLDGTCINCKSMSGANGSVHLAAQRCDCITGFYWNPALKKCACDYSVNFAVTKGLCIDCKTVYLSNGLANVFGCICSKGFKWDANKGQCICPVGNVITEQSCISCSNVSLPSGTTTA